MNCLFEFFNQFEVYYTKQRHFNIAGTVRRRSITDIMLSISNYAIVNCIEYLCSNDKRSEGNDVTLLFLFLTLECVLPMYS